MKIRWNISRRLQASALAVAGTVLCAVVGWGYISGRSAIFRETQERALFFAEGAAGIFDGRMLRQQGTIQGVAAAIAADRGGITLEGVKDLQARVLLQDSAIYGVAVAWDPSFSPPGGLSDRAPYTWRKDDGTLGYKNIVGENNAYAREDWYTAARDAGGPIWTVPFVYEGILMVTFSCPMYVFEEGAFRFIGVATCDITLDWLDEQLRQLPSGADGYAFLMNRNGLFVAHPQRGLILKKTIFDLADERNSPKLGEIAGRMLTGAKGVENHLSVVTGQQSWMAYLPLRSADWVFSAVLSQEGMRARLNALARQQAGIAMAGLLLLLGALSIVARSITVPVEKLRTAAQTLAAGNLHAPLPEAHGDDEIADLTRSFATMRDNLERQMVELAETSASRERMQSQLRIAHDIQMGLVPKTFPPIPNRDDLDLFACLKPAYEVGGDFYDFFPLSSDELVIIIGDVADKGVPAALYMAATRSFLRSYFRADAPQKPGQVLETLNRELAADNPSCMFVTLFCASLRLTDGRFLHANAGHNPPLLLHPDGRTEFLSEPRGPVAGALESVRYETGERTLPPGTCLLLYTDGVTEAARITNEMFGEERMVESATRVGSTATCRQLIEALLDDLAKFTGDALPSDDITMLAVKHRVEPGSAGAGWRWSYSGTMDDVGAAADSLEGWLGKQGVAVETCYTVRLALEELATNALKFSGAPGSLSSSFSLRPAKFVIEDDGPPFNPWSDAPDPDVSAPMDAREPGALGLHLVRSMAGSVSYERRGRTNVVGVVFSET